MRDGKKMDQWKGWSGSSKQHTILLTENFVDDGFSSYVELSWRYVNSYMYVTSFYLYGVYPMDHANGN